MFLRTRTSRYRTGGALVAGLVTSALLLTGCSSGGGGSSTAAPSGSTITVFNGATGTITENFNPFSTTALQPTLGVIFEPLYWYNLASDTEPTPLLATGFEWNEDGTQLDHPHPRGRHVERR
ncbi:hypothetical protein [Cellulomonas soli]